MKAKFHVEGLDCPHCAARLEKMLSDTEGIKEAKINFLTEKITVESDLADDELLLVVSRVAESFHKGTTVSRI